MSQRKFKVHVAFAYGPYWITSVNAHLVHELPPELVTNLLARRVISEIKETYETPAYVEGVVPEAEKPVVVPAVVEDEPSEEQE